MQKRPHTLHQKIFEERTPGKRPLLDIEAYGQKADLLTLSTDSNGTLTIGTRDGATIEMAQQTGEENFFLFGLTAVQVTNTFGWYNPRWHCENESEVRQAIDTIQSNYLSCYEPGIFNPLVDMPGQKKPYSTS